MNIEKSLKKIIRKKELRKRREDIISVIIAVSLILLFVSLVINSVAGDVKGSQNENIPKRNIVYSRGGDSFSVGYIGNNIMVHKTGDS